VCANVFCAQVLAGETIVEYLANNYVVWAWDMTSDANRIRSTKIQGTFFSLKIFYFILDY
jgi:hypothetical protein